ncbi:MAG: uracil-DNA glycosylase [Pseudomonadota bacterium]
MTAFDLSCRRCDRLAQFLDNVRNDYPDYHAAPVAAFGVKVPRLLIVGLAPGMHGANRTGRPFTGDHAGTLLYETLHAYGFASQAKATSAHDGMELLGCRITNAVKCLPPSNKPLGGEVTKCNGYLRTELCQLPSPAVVLALGAIAHQAVIKAIGLRQKDHPFGHAAEHALSDELTLVDSYHCSRYNTQTRRLTPGMFREVFARVRTLIDGGSRR